MRKLGVSYALGQSIKLNTFENEVREVLLDVQTHPQELALTGKIRLSGTEIAKLIGERLFSCIRGVENCTTPQGGCCSSRLL